MNTKRIRECVPNFSEGRNKETIKAIVSAIENGGRTGCGDCSIKVLNVDPGEAANRTVITFAGSPEAVVEAAYQGVIKAAELIDMRTQSGEHPRSGATDVLPLVPVSGVTLEECAEMARNLARRIYQESGIPCYCYEAAAFKPQRRNLAVCRAGEYEALPEKILDPERRPDFGPDSYTDVVARSGAINVGARNFLIAVNFNLNTTSVSVAQEIACQVREKGRRAEDGSMIPGKLKGCKAIGWFIEEYGIAQVSMNITDIKATPLHVAYEEVRKSAQALGYDITGTEIIGLVPECALIDAGKHFLGEQKAVFSDKKELMDAAVRGMGLDDLKPYNPQERVIEYLIEELKRPKVSVVMSFCNEPLEWIAESVASVRNQTFRDFELIIICDNPDFKEGIEHIRNQADEDDRIKLICNPKNIGLTRSLNIGIEAARGEYIARLDADDICLPERLEKQVAYLDENPQVDICASNAHIINAAGEITRRNRYIKKTDPIELLISNIIAHPSVMMRRSLAELRKPLYNEEFTYSQDYELWQFMFLRGIEPHILKEPLLLYRKSPQQVSVTQKKLQVGFFKKAHKNLIINWLINKGIICGNREYTLEEMLDATRGAYRSADVNDRKYLAHIIYVLYFSLATYRCKYKWAYLFDRNRFAFKIKFIFTFRLFFSRKTRKNRTGFN